MTKSVYIPAAEFRRLYVDQRMPMMQIGARYGMTGSGIRYRLMKAGIERRPYRSFDPNTTQNRLMVQRYVRDGWSSCRLALDMHVSAPTIVRWLRLCGVQIRSPVDPAARLRGRQAA